MLIWLRVLTVDSHDLRCEALRMIYHSMLATTRSLFWAIAMLRPGFV